MVEADIYDFRDLIAEPGGRERHLWIIWYYRKTGRDFRHLRRDIIHFLDAEIIAEIGFGAAYTGYWFEMRREWLERETKIANNNNIGCRENWKTPPNPDILKEMLGKLSAGARIRHLPFRGFARIHCLEHTEDLIALFR